MPINDTTYTSPQAPSEVMSRVLDDSAADLRITGARTLANYANRNRIRSVSSTVMDWPVRFDGATANIQPVEDDTVETETDVSVAASLRIGSYKVSARRKFSRLAIQEVATRAPGELKDLFRDEMESAVSQIARDMNSLIYTGDGTPAKGDFNGLALLMDNSSAYAGIDPVNYPAWQAILTDNGAVDRPFSRQLMLDHDVTYSNLERSYDMVIMNPTMAARYQSLFDNLAGIQSLPDRAEGNALKRADLGHGGRYFNSMPIVEDPTCPDGQILTLDSSELMIKCFTVDNTPNNPSAISPIAINTSIGLPIHIAELPSSNSLYRQFELYVIPQHQVRNRRAIGAITDLETA